tara:strand:+ start:116 stop:673 length:558 start_codon:yes stop_codon:yes gene_type:complete
MNYLVTGLICSGKSTLLDVAKNYSFRTYKSDEIVSSLYQDEYIVNQLKNSVCIKQTSKNFKDDIRDYFFKSRKNKEEIENIIHPIVHAMILDIFSKNDNSMIEIPPIINNEFLFKKYNTIYVDAPEEARRKRYNTNNKNDIDIFDQLNSFQNDYEIIKKSCNIIIKNTNSPCSLNKYFNEGIIKT